MTAETFFDAGQFWLNGVLRAPPAPEQWSWHDEAQATLNAFHGATP